MLIKAVAKSSFYHGNKQYENGYLVEVTKGEAHDLERDGLIDIEGEFQPQAEESGVKMADPVENKLADAPANKSRGPKAK